MSPINTKASASYIGADGYGFWPLARRSAPLPSDFKCRMSQRVEPSVGIIQDANLVFSRISRDCQCISFSYINIGLYFVSFLGYGNVLVVFHPLLLFKV